MSVVFNDFHTNKECPQFFQMVFISRNMVNLFLNMLDSVKKLSLLLTVALQVFMI